MREPLEVPFPKSWPFRDGSVCSPERIWANYVQREWWMRELERQLRDCAKRIHNQRAEINRLLEKANES